ncbi:huntingtin-interacting protein 1-like [Saccoglossus kowalevskii]
MKYRSHIIDLGKLWGHLEEGYGKLIAAYCTLIVTKLDFHHKNPKVPGNLQMTEDELDALSEGDVNNFFQLTVELFDYLDAVLGAEGAVFNSFDPRRSNSMTSTGQCRLAPLIPMIQDASQLYDLSVKILFKLHGCLPGDTLAGHRERFKQQFRALKDFFHKASNLQYFKHLIQVPQLPENPPNFLIASDYSSHISPVVVMATQDDDVDSIMTPDSPPSTPVDETLVVFGQNVDLFSDETKLCKLFGDDDFASQNGQFGASPPPVPPLPVKDERDQVIERLKQEILTLRRQMDDMRDVDQRLIDGLKMKINQLETDLIRTQEDSATMKIRLDESITLASQVPQEKVVDLEKRVKVNEEKFKKMKDVYNNLREEHVKLIRKNAEVSKQLTVVSQTTEETEKAKKEAAESLERMELAVKEKEVSCVALIKKTNDLEEIIVAKTVSEDALRTEIEHLQRTLDDKIASEQGLRKTEEGLQKAVEEKRAAEEDLRMRVGNLERTVQEKMEVEEDFRKQVSDLQKTIVERTTAEEALKKKMEEDTFGVLVNSVEEAEDVIRKALDEMENPQFSSSTCTAEYLLTRMNSLEESLNSTKSNYDGFADNNSVVSSLVRSVASFSHLLSDFILHGKATSHMAPVDRGLALSDHCKSSGEKALELLAEVKQKNNKDRVYERTVKVQTVLKDIQNIAQGLVIKDADVGKEELGDMVDLEMQTTAEQVDEAVKRIEEMLNKSREESSGIQLEVNSRILDACTLLMRDIKVLINRSKVLQSEIVDVGKGTSSSKEFYARNNRWTEGLISAAKAVGWGASVLVDGADKVVLGSGKYEELIACSHEIAASTAQLVAASRVKAGDKSKTMQSLHTASRKVAESTANVVATAKSGAQMIEEKDTMDFSKMTLMETKRLEMDSQVEVLELESRLEKERRKLAGLRKQHYQLAGESEGWDEQDQEAAQDAVDAAARN